MSYTVDRVWNQEGTAGEGTNNKKFDSVGGSVGTATCVFGTNNTVRYILMKPATSNSTSGTPAAAQDFGYNILKADMNVTTGTPNKRKILTGTWTFRVLLNASTADTSSVFTIKVYVHRRSSSGTLTELFNAESGTFIVNTAVPSVSVTNVTFTKTGVAQQLFDTDETVQVEYWIQGRGGGTTGIISQTITFLNVWSGFTSANLLFPSVIATEYYRELVASGTGTCTLIRSVGKIHSTTASGVPTLHRAIGKAVSVTATGVPSISRAITKTLTVAAQGTATVIKTVGKIFTADGTGVASISRNVGKQVTASASGVMSLMRSVSKFVMAIAQGSPSIGRGVSKTLEVTATGVASGTIGVPFDQGFPSGGGGGGETSSTFIT